MRGRFDGRRERRDPRRPYFFFAAPERAEAACLFADAARLGLEPARRFARDARRFVPCLAAAVWRRTGAVPVKFVTATTPSGTPRFPRSWSISAGSLHESKMALST